MMQHMDRANTDGFLSLGERNRNAVTSHPYGWWNIHTSNRYMSENKKNVRYTLQLLWYENHMFILIVVCIVLTICDLPFYRMHLFLLSLLQQHLPQSALVLVERRLFACHEIFSYVVLIDSWTVPESHISDTMK